MVHRDRPRAAALLLLACAGCGSSATPLADAGHDAGFDSGFGPPSGFVDGGLVDASWKRVDGGYVVPDAGVLPDDRFVTKVVSYQVGPCGGYNEASLPGIVEGPPVGGGPYMGSTDVFSLGNGGEIVVSFEPNAIVDGPGPDFIVFENPFYLMGTTTVADPEPGEVSVSEDGVHWWTFPCSNTTGNPPFQQCAGVHPVFSSPGNGISPLDPMTAGGDPYDLSDLEAGVTEVKYVRIVDKIIEPCMPGENEDGFDLDAVAVVNGALP